MFLKLKKDESTTSFKNDISFFFTVVLLTSCKKDDDDLTNTTKNITLLNTNDWKVVAQHAQPKTQGNLGGSFGTQAFSLQSPNELRWYLWFSHMSGYQDPIEIILNNQNAVVVNKPTGNTGTDFRPIKTIYSGNTWETHIPFTNTYNIAVFMNNQNININLSDPNATTIKRLQASEDGLLNNSEATGTNTVSHYHYGTGQWKTNAFFATSFVSVRYNNRTYVINLNKNTSQDGIGIYSETDNQGSGSHYPMNAENHLNISPVGFILHSTQYGDNVFVAIDAYGNKFEVYKINLTSFTIQKVLDETKVGTYSQYANEIDAAGNLYTVENRIENQTSHFSIRKYKTNGGNEVILEESDLKEHTQIHALKYFNSKLHAAVVYREENPKDWTDNTYHMQIINQQ